MPERRNPVVTELALADALDRLVNLIEELRADADLRVEITTDETDLVKLTFSGIPDVGFPMQREVRDIPAEIVRRVWNEACATTRFCSATTTRSAHSAPWRPRHMVHSPRQ